MSTATPDSSAELRIESAAARGAAGRVDAPPVDGELWLEGGVLACACPDCSAPMSIRLWLRVADCWRCGASFELSEEQERAAFRLLREHEAARAAEYQQAIAAMAPAVGRQPIASPAATPSPASRPQEVSAPRPARTATVAKGPAATAGTGPPPPPPSRAAAARRVPAAEAYRSPQARTRKLARGAGLAALLAGLLDELPAWLVSLVLHAVAMILAGMWFTTPPGQRHEIVLSTSISPQDFEGDQGLLNDDPKAFEFETPGAVEIVRDVDPIGLAEKVEPPPQLLSPAMEVPDPMGEIPNQATRTPVPMATTTVGKMFQGRDPQLRAQLVKKSGGTTFTEAAVARGLKFLARHQRSNGSWSFSQFNRTPDCDDTCASPGRSTSDVAATALSLLPFLGAGQTHQSGDYTQVVLKGLNWLVEQQRDNGDLRGNGDGQMYAHGQATIVLCEAFAMTGDEQLRTPAQQAVNFIVHAQNDQGGWRYQPGQAGDTSVLGWELMALQSARMAYLRVPPKTFELAEAYLDRAQRDRVGGRYGYQPGVAPTPSMTAEGLLCREYLGWPKTNPGLQSGVRWLIGEHLPNPRQPNIYYWYYGTQVMHHYGGEAWSKWNYRMRPLLCDTQEKKGHAAGSWAPVGYGMASGFADHGGRIYVTALAVCTLEVYYRHLPLYGTDAAAVDAGDAGNDVDTGGGLEGFK